MLYNRLMENKTYEDRFDEGIAQIPLYCPEWTNFNPADPGITILESLALFETIQQDNINTVPADVTAKLLKMAGFEQIKGRQARVLLKCTGNDKMLLIPQGQQFCLGDVSYEVTHNTYIENCNVIAVYSKCDNELKDRSHVLDQEIQLSAKIFGDEPRIGNEVYFICDNLPQTDSDMFFYFTCVDHGRNPFEEKKTELFAKLKWECFTDEGFVEMNSIDYTGGFLTSGEIRFRKPYDATAAIFEELPTKGYCIRGILEKANYDVIPCISAIDDFLFEAWQRKTKAYIKKSDKSNHIRLNKKKTDESYLTVFVREDKNEPFHVYQQGYEGASGRYYDVTEDGEDLIFSFDAEKYGFGPDNAKNCVRIVVYDEDTMRHYNLDKILGYDDQIIELPFKNVVKESVSLIAKHIENGEELYDFVRVGHDKNEDLDYTLDEQNGLLCIRNAGKYIGAQLMIGACAVTMGSEGNVRANNIFEAVGLPRQYVFKNPKESTGGRYRESLESVRKRFLQDIDVSSVAVCEEDYEKLVLSTPGLCIKKARAIQDFSKNQVKITALVDDGSSRPVLSENYQKLILERINDHRLLCTKVTLVKPEYIPINVSSTIYVKAHFEGKADEIEQILKKKLNYVSSDNSFGERLSYEEVFKIIESLPYVAYVYDLRLSFAKTNQGSIIDQDIIPSENGLIVPGNINLELVTHYEK